MIACGRRSRSADSLCSPPPRSRFKGCADVELPMGHAKPLSGFFVSVAATGERKSAVDQRHCGRCTSARPRCVKLPPANGSNMKTTRDRLEGSAREAAVQKAKGDRARSKAALDAFGSAPLPPLEPMLTCGEPTYEGLCKLLAVGQPSVGIFAAEGGQFIGGHGMADDAKLRTAAGIVGAMGWRAYQTYSRRRRLHGAARPARRGALNGAARRGRNLVWRSAACRAGAYVARLVDGARAGERHPDVERAVARK